MLANTSFALFGGGGGSGIVHDPKQTAATIGQLKKQLEEWSKQHKAMTHLNDLSKNIMNYQKELNGFIGDAKQASAKIIEAKNLIERLGKLDQIEEIAQLEAEIGKLTDMTKITDILNEKKGVYGELKKEVNGVEIKRDESKYKRHAIASKRVASYEAERSTTVSELDILQSDLITAVNKAKNAGTEVEQIAVLSEIETINARIGILQLRYSVRMGDLEAQVLANTDREMLEKQNRSDVISSTQKQNRKESTSNFKKSSEQKAEEHEKSKSWRKNREHY